MSNDEMYVMSVMAAIIFARGTVSERIAINRAWEILREAKELQSGKNAGVPGGGA